MCIGRQTREIGQRDVRLKNDFTAPEIVHIVFKFPSGRETKSSAPSQFVFQRISNEPLVSMRFHTLEDTEKTFSR